LLKNKCKFYFWSLAALGEGISGGDRIFMELARHWSKKQSVVIHVWEEGYRMCLKQGLQKYPIKFEISKMEKWARYGFVVNYFARIIEGILLGMTKKLDNKPTTFVYSSSEFWMDCLPAFLLKLRYPRIIWLASWYQTAPNPLKGFSQGKREKTYKAKAFLYWLSQQPIKPLISKFADFVFVNNDEEKKQFPEHAKQRRAIVVLGAVDLKAIKNWSLKNGRLPKVYDAVFQGRFHPQKGVLELIDIWKMVVEKKPEARLAMIGDGPLRKDVELLISNYQLEDNVTLFGYVFDGHKKYKIFSQSKIVVHPAFYDSGGMAAAEAMAFGLPCVGFDLKAYSSYYPKGMLKAKYGNLRDFAQKILKLLENEKIRKKIGKEALEMIEKNWSWEKRASEVLDKIGQ